MIDVIKERANTPGCADRVHLNNAGAALQPRDVTEAVLEYLRDEAVHGGYETYAARMSEIEEFYANTARLLNCHSRNIAFEVNATEAFSKALSAIPFKKGEVILTSINDYTSNQIQFLSLAKKWGVHVLHAPDLPGGGIDPDAVGELILQYSPKVVCVTHVPTNSGLVQDVGAVGRICRETGTTYIVDACQSVGQIPVDALGLDCDFLSGTMRKFLRGPRGGGFLYVSDDALRKGFEPLMIDMRGADMTSATAYRPRPDAKRFESWEANYGVVRGSAVAVDHALGVGLENIRDRNSILATQLREGLSELDRVEVLDKGRQLCSIVTCYIRSAKWTEVSDHLKRAGINCSFALRQNNQMDFGKDGKNVPWALRLSPHYYNTGEEITRAVEAIRAFPG